MSQPFPRCSIVPLAGHQVSLRIDDCERTRWHYGPEYPRPFFYPVVGPSGQTLTRMGHPGAPDHDHHRSVWFAHSDLLGHNFWGDQTSTKIVQHQWLTYEDGEEEARLAVKLHWLDGHDPQPLLQQEVTAAFAPYGDEGEWTLELQAEFVTQATGIEFRKSNFGILAVRMAKSISEHFGQGRITGASGGVGEPATFGEPNRWMDYSGPTKIDANGEPIMEGITLFDHVDNPAHPARWHTRVDGWMGPSLTRLEPILLVPDQPLCVRYLLHMHAGPIDPKIADKLSQEFANRKKFVRIKSTQPHVHWDLHRAGT